MKDKVEMRFRITVDGSIGGSFEVDRKVFERLRKKWEARGNRHRETEVAEELLALAPFNYFQHLIVEEMEIEELEESKP